MLEAAVADAIGDGWKRRTALGSLLAVPMLLAIPAGLYLDPWLVLVAVVPAIVLVGYGTRILATPATSPALPPVDDWRSLGRATLSGTLVVVGLIVGPAAAFAFVLGTVGTALPPNARWIAASLFGFVVVAGLYATPAVLAVVGRSNEASGGGALATVGSVMGSRDYVVATLQAILLWFTAAATAVMLLVTVFGLVLVPTVVFLAHVVVTRRYAYAVDRTLDPASIEALEDASIPGL